MLRKEREGMAASASWEGLSCELTAAAPSLSGRSAGTNLLPKPIERAALLRAPDRTSYTSTASSCARRRRRIVRLQLHRLNLGQLDLRRPVFGHNLCNRILQLVHAL